MPSHKLYQMLFNSLIFLIFCTLFFSLFWIVKKQNKQLSWIYITFFSFVFYGWWDWRFLFLIIGSGLIDFFAGGAIYKYPRYRKPLLALSIICNIGTLAAFKYSQFIFSQIELLLAQFNLQINLTKNYPEFLYILPVGISFYTFQSMSYTIDIYKKNLTPTNTCSNSLLIYQCFLNWWPDQLFGQKLCCHNSTD